MFFERRLSDRDMCDPPTRPRPSLLIGGRYSAEANAALAERWRTLAVLQTRGVETAGWKAQASAATDAASAACDDAREARETELGTHEANATRSSQVVVSTATPELESEEETWAKRVPWSRVNVVHRDTDTNVADEGVDLLSSATYDDDDDERFFFHATGDPVPSRSPFAVCEGRRAKDGSHSSLASSLAFEAESFESSVRRENRSARQSGVGEATRLASPRDLRDLRDLRFGGADDDAPRGSAPEEDEPTELGGEDPLLRVTVLGSAKTNLGSAKTPRDVFLEAVEAVEREDESRRREAERYIAAKHAGVIRKSTPADAGDAGDAAGDDAVVGVLLDRREANAAALIALRRSLELNSPPAPPRVRTRVPGRAKKPKSSASAAKSRAPTRDATRRRDEKTSWEPEKTWPPLPAAEPDETAVAEEEADAVRAEGGVARPGETLATPNGGPKPADRASASSSSSVWAAIVAGEGAAGAPCLSVTKRSYVTGVSVARTTETVSKQHGFLPVARADTLEVFEETTPEDAEARTRERASAYETAEAALRRCEDAAAALEDAVRAAVDARAAAAVRAPEAARAMDEKMASSARTLLGEGDGEGGDDANGTEEEKKSIEKKRRETTTRGDPGWFFFDIEECFAPDARVPRDADTAHHIPRVCRWRSAHGSSFALEPAPRDAAALGSKIVENPKIRMTSEFHRVSPTSLID